MNFSTVSAMQRAEAGPPAPEPHPLDPIARTRIGTVVVRRNGEHFYPGPLLDTASLPLLD